MKRRLTNNLFLKIISVMIAILVWLMIANINDPIVTKTYSVPVTIQNSAYIESIGKTYRVEDTEQTATVILRGHSSLVEKRANDIQAVADLTQIVDMNSKPYVMVPITVTCEGILPENITVIPRNMKVVIEEMESKEFAVGVTSTGTPDSAYRIGTGSLEANPTKVTIMGPASLIQVLDTVVATVDVAGLKGDTVKTSDLKVYDKNGTELLENQMDYLKFKDMAETTIEVQVNLWKVRSDVALKVNYSGSPGDGYEVIDISVTPANINVAGTDEALEQLSENNNTIEIAAEEVELAGETQNLEKTIDLAKYLPEDIILANDTKSAIVQVKIMPIGSKEFTIPTKNITGVNLDNERYKAVYETDKLEIRVKGDSESLTKVNENTVKPVIDFQGKEPGTYVLPVQVTLPEGCELLEDVTVSVQIMELE